MAERSQNAERRAEYEAELVCPEFPAVLGYLWRIYLRLDNRRGSNGFSTNPISFVEIETFSRLTRTPLTAWEVELIEMLDVLQRNELNRKPE